VRGAFGFFGLSLLGLAAFFAFAGEAGAGATSGAGSDIFFLTFLFLLVFTRQKFASI
jgi:hypothetical protein